MWIVLPELSKCVEKNVKAFFRGMAELQFGKMGQPQETSGTVRFEVYSTRNSLTQMQQ